MTITNWNQDRRALHRDNARAFRRSTTIGDNVKDIFGFREIHARARGLHDLRGQIRALLRVRVCVYPGTRAFDAHAHVGACEHARYVRAYRSHGQTCVYTRFYQTLKPYVIAVRSISYVLQTRSRKWNGDRILRQLLQLHCHT